MLPTPLLLALLSVASTALPGADDPVTGTWEALIAGDVEGLPPEGIPLVLGCELIDELEVRASLEMQGVRTDGIAATYDPETGELSFQANHAGVVVGADLVIGDDVLTGTMSGLGAKIELKGRRVSRDLPARAAETPPAPVDPAKLTPEDWRTDLRTLADRLPAVHKNAFHTVTSEEWARQVDALDARLEELDARGTAVAFAQLVALVGDAHTEFGWNSLPLWTELPLRMRSFADGLFVVGADEAYAEMLGARVVGIGALPIEEAMERAATTFGAENESWRREKVPGQLVIPELLVALGIADDADAIPFTLESFPGETFEVIVGRERTGPMLRAPDPDLDPVPLWRKRTGATYWFTPLLDAKAVYFAYNRCVEDLAQPMSTFVEELLAEVEAGEANRLVIDLRHNAGGNSSILSSQLPALFAHPNLQAPGSIVALIGPRTYSSGMMNAEQIRQAGGVLLGEPTGGRPNSYGEVRSFRLPRTGLTVHYSTKYFRMLDDDPPAVLPDEEVPMTSSDWLSGRDPVLERALGR